MTLAVGAIEMKMTKSTLESKRGATSIAPFFFQIKISSIVKP